MIPFNFHHLYYFYKVAEEGSVSRAAKALRLAQPTLSQQLKQFESYFETRLFEREGRRLKLTEVGHDMMAYAKAIFDLGTEMADRMADRSRPGRLRLQVGVSGHVPKAAVMSLLEFVGKQFPGTYLNVTEEPFQTMAAGLKAHKLDLVVNDVPYQGPREEGIQNRLLARVPVVFCASRRMARRYRRIPQDLKAAPMILPTAQSQTYHDLQEYFLKHRVQPEIIAEIQDIEIVRRMVMAGTGIAPLNIYSVTHAPGGQQLEILGGKKVAAIHDSLYLIIKERKIPHPVVTGILRDFEMKWGEIS